MLISYLKVTLRCMARQAYASFIHVLGFSVGLAVAFLLLLWVYHEFSYDAFHEGHESIFRVGMHFQFREEAMSEGSVMATLGPALSERLPALETMVRTTARLHSMNLYDPHSERSLADQRVLFADEAFFRLFSFPLIAGDPVTALAHPHSLVLTQSMAHKLFPDSDPLGRTLSMNGLSFLVTGVAADPPSATHFDFDLVVSFEALYDESLYGESLHSWYNINSRLYVGLRQGTDPDAFRQNVHEVIGLHTDEELRKRVIFEPFLQPLRSIYTDQEIPGGFKENIQRERIRILLLVNLLLLVVVCINYVVHSMARASLRWKEIGMRKVMGASRRAIALQFLGESLFITLVASVVALLIMELVLPLFNATFGADIRLFSANQLAFFLVFPFLVALLGLVAGAYPALFLSGLLPVALLRERFIGGARGRVQVRHALIVLQMCIASGLLMCVAVMHRQFQLIVTKDLGYATENRIVIPLRSAQVRNAHTLLKDRLNQVPGVLAAAGADKAPGAFFSASPVGLEGLSEDMTLHRHMMEPGFLEAMDIQVVKGRGFLPEMRSDAGMALVNETLVRSAGWNEPLGKRLWWRLGERDREYRIIGVVGDYHFTSLHEPVKPLVIYMMTFSPSYLVLKLEGAAPGEIIERVRSSWVSAFPDEPFHFYHLDEAFESDYRQERTLRKMIHFFSAFILLISLMGLYGLVYLDTVSRIREIAIRKVFGASARDIVKRFAKHYSLLLLLAGILAWPPVFLVMDRWLASYAYRAQILDPWLYLLPLALLLIAVLAGNSIQLLRVARTHPAESLRRE